MQTSTLFSSARQDWTTPPALFRRLDAEFRFTLDAAASPENALCSRYFTEAEDALSQPWTGRVFCNPPYSAKVGQWVAYGWHEVYAHRHAEVVVMLVAARTDTAWFHQYALSGAEIRFIRGRLRFGGSTNSAPFPSLLLVFRAVRIGHPVVTTGFGGA